MKPVLRAQGENSGVFRFFSHCKRGHWPPGRKMIPLSTLRITAGMRRASLVFIPKLRETLVGDRPSHVLSRTPSNRICGRRTYYQGSREWKKNAGMGWGRRPEISLLRASGAFFRNPESSRFLPGISGPTVRRIDPSIIRV